MRLGTGTAGSSLLVVVLVACAGGVGGPGEAGQDGVRFWVHGSAGSGGGEDALIEGEVAVDDDTGCVYLDAGGGPYPVIWPHGTDLARADPLQLRLRDGTTVAVGDHVQGGGGYHKAEDYPDLGIPGSCLNEYGEVARFNQGETLMVRRRP
jgi:hypothetical protein